MIVCGLVALAACATPAPPPVVTVAPPPPPVVEPERLAIPASGRHVVQPGETLAGISYRYNIKLAPLAAANGIGNRDLVRAGEVLALRWEPAPEVAAPPLRRSAGVGTGTTDDVPLRVILTPLSTGRPTTGPSS